MSTPNQSSLRHAWEAEAQAWLAWTRHGHDSFDRFHREQFLALVPAPGRLTVDVGCGEGRVARALKAAGHTVVGFDGSPILVDAARKADPSIPVHVADALALPLADAEADLAIAFMCLHDFDDLDGAVREIARVLPVDGRLCLAIVHPINSAGGFSSSDSDSPFTINGSYLDVNRYSDHIERDGLTMTYHSCHRPLEHYITALQENKLVIEVLREPRVPEHAVQDASDRRWQRLPLFLHVRARKLAR